MAKVTKRGDELQSKKLELLEDITSTVREIYKIKGPIKDVRTVIDVLGGKVIENSQTDNMDILVCQNGVQIVIPGYTAREQKNMHLAKGIGYIYLYSNYMANNKKYDVNDAMKMHNIYIFALSFMMPRHEYLQVLLAETKGNVADTKKIAEYFHVPEMSAIMRGVYLGYLELF